MRVVASMLVRNEVDFIEEVVRNVMSYVDTLCILDGDSDDGTLDILAHLQVEYEGQDKQVAVRSRPDPGEKFRDVYRQELLEFARTFDPDWHWTIDGDEIADGDPTPFIKEAEEKRCNIITCQVPQFWLTFDDIRRGLINEEWEEPVRSVIDRRRWYTWGWRGDFIFKEYDTLYYPDERKRTAEGFPHRNVLKLQKGPVIRHYCFRSLSQSVKRMQERLARGGTWFFGKYREAWLIDESKVALHYLRDPWPPGEWNTENNHGEPYKWFGLVGSIQ